MTQTAAVLALFPGQGSQKVGMGKELSAQSDVARDIFARADKALGFSLSGICFDGPAERLTATEIAQPAILTVSVICFELAKAKLGNSLKIVAAAGHSLGEYSALVAAGAMKFEDAVSLVNKRGRYMQNAVPAGVGKMVAILGKETAEIEAAIGMVKSGVVEIANSNAPGQIVISGKRSAVEECVSHLGTAKAIELAVSAPFHCSLMEPAAVALAKDLDATTIAPAQFPIYANVSARAVQSPQEIRDALKRQVCGQVRWIESMQHAIAERTPASAIEFGAGNVLCGLLKRINNAVPRIECGSLDAVAKLAA